MPDCLFCQIVAGDVPSTRVYEDDDALAFMDITQTVPGHVLIVPRQHAATMFDVDPDAYAKLFSVAHRVAVAVKEGLNAPGINILQNNGRAAGQVIDHLHVHVLARAAHDGYRMNWDDIPATNAELESWATRIREQLAK